MKRDDDELDLLLQKLRWLKLPGMVQRVAALLEQAARDNLTMLEVLHRLADEERHSRLKRAIDGRIQDARFPEVNTVDGFDFDPVRKRLRARYLALHDLAFLGKGLNPLFLELPGTGKTVLARALAYRACQGAHRVVVISATRMLPACSTTSPAPSCVASSSTRTSAPTSWSSIISPSSPWTRPRRSLPSR